MKFGICNETFQDWPLDRAFAFAQECGYTGIEIAPFTLASDARAIDATQRDAVRRAAETHELEVIGLHWLLAKTEGYHLTTADRTIRQRTADYFGELARLCRDLGGRVLVFGSPQQRNLPEGMSSEEGIEHALEVIQAALPTIEECDVILAMEPLGPAEGNFLNTAQSAIELIERVGSPNCRLHLDVKAMSSEATPIAEIIRMSAPFLQHFHANDANRLGPGFGEIEFEPIFEALGQIDYRGWVSVEVFDYSPGVETLARESIDYMQECLTRLANT